MIDHVSKPIDPAVLFETVGRHYRPPSNSNLEKTSERDARAMDNGLPSIAGLDTNDGVSRVAGNRKLYVSLLRQFAEQQGSAVTQIATALERGDSSLAERLAHTLKGVAGNIGAKAVQSAASTLEKLIRNRASAAELESAKQSVSAALDPLVAQIHGLDTTVSKTEPLDSVAPAPEPAQSREAAAHLNQLLTECDPAAADFVTANRTTLRPLFAGDTWPQFEKLVQDYSFADAQQKLNQAQTSFPA
jgi:HPt (histidine-containing phosphotransfer) domain-containing protein